MPPKDKLTTDEAVFDIRERMMRMETVLIGVPDTGDKGVVGQVVDNTKDLNATRKKVGKLEVRYWILIAFLTGSGALGGTALFKLLTIAPS